MKSRISSIATKGINPKLPACPRREDLPLASMPSKPTIFLLRIEARTGFVSEALVTIDFCIGIAFFEHGHQL